MGIVVVACLAAIVGAVVTVKMTSGLASTSFAARLGQAGDLPLRVFDQEGEVFPLAVSELREPLAEPL